MQFYSINQAYDAVTMSTAIGQPLIHYNLENMFKTGQLARHIRSISPTLSTITQYPIMSGRKQVFSKKHI